MIDNEDSTSPWNQDFAAMSETQYVGLTKDQRDLLLRGLRYVRNSVALEMHDPTPDFLRERREQLSEIDTLVDQLNGSQPAHV